MNTKLRSEQMDLLTDALLSLETREECYRFLEDICTIHEMQSLAQRWAVAVSLRQGETYHRIAEETGASSATISRVGRCLSYGADGYTLVLNRLGVAPHEKQEGKTHD